MRVGRTVEQLRQRRHAFLGTYIPPNKERQVQKVDPSQQVGQLKGVVGGDKVSLIITLGEDFWIGRRPECDLVINDPTISNFHMRIYAIRTSCEQSLICVHDLSTNGFVLNGETYRSDQQVDVGGSLVNPRGVILRPGDVLKSPGCSIELVCRYSSEHSSSTQNEGPTVQCHVPALFKSSDSTLSRNLHPWMIQNFNLGTGSFGRVHLATHNENRGLQAACKTVSVNKQIEVEIQILKELNHPNLCGIYDVFKEEHAQLIHLFLPLVTGGDLFSYLEKHTALTEDETKFAALQLIKAVDFLHQAGIAHRDLKPENILLQKTGAYPHLLLADFGLATTRQQVLSQVPYNRSNVPERHHRLFTGTSLYLPPERLKAILSRKRSNTGQAESSHGIDRWRITVGDMWFTEETMLDIWALGAILCLILTGFHPYDERLERDDTVMPRGTEASRATTIRPSPAQSWDNFRSTNPSGIVGDGPQTEQEKEWRRVEERCIRFCKLRSASWRPVEKWVYISSEAKSFVEGFLQPHPSKRSTLEEARLHSWLSTQQFALEKIYDNVVTEGKFERASVWNFNGGVQPSTTSVRSKSVGNGIMARVGEDIEMEDDSMIRGTPIPLPHGNQEAGSDGLSELDTQDSSGDPKATTPKQNKRKSTTEIPTTTQPKKQGRPKKVAPVSNENTSTPSSSKPIKKKPGPKPNIKKSLPAPPTSLFLNSPLFGLDDIAEEVENDQENADNQANTAITLNDVINASTTGGDQDIEMEGVEESHPPRKAGQRKAIPVSKAVSPAFNPASMVAGVSKAPPVGTSNSVKPPAARKPAFQPPAKRPAPGVVLKRVDKTVAA